MKNKIYIVLGLIIGISLASLFFFIVKNKDRITTSECGFQPQIGTEKIPYDTSDWRTIDEGGYGYKFKKSKLWSVSHIQNGKKNTHLSYNGNSITITEITSDTEIFECGAVVTIGGKNYHIVYDFRKDDTPSEWQLEIMQAIVDSFEFSPTESQELDTHKTYEITGYYSPYQRPMYTIDYNSETDPPPKTSLCKAFTIVSGDFKFINYYKNRIMMGNTINKLNNENNLVFNINPEELIPVHKEKLINSNKENQITLQFKVKEPGERDANFCESVINLISVK